jgi:hypothetical protein
MADSAPEYPAVGTRVVHADDHAKSAGPVWKVSGHDAKKQEVKLNTVPGHKLNANVPATARDVPLTEFKEKYVQL